jgi:hypothetical protein
MIRKSHIAAAVLLASVISAAPASADPNCHTRHGSVTIQIMTDSTCPSIIGLCANVQFLGGLHGESRFTGTSLVPSVDAATTGIVFLTGDNHIRTREGDLFVKDAIVFNTTGAAEFSEVDTIVGGTGEYEGATGRLQAIGKNNEGSFVVEICTP